MNKICPVCESKSERFDVVDFNKSCEELRGRFLPLSGRPIYYYRCGNCLFCHAPEFEAWSEEDFIREIYNQEYIEIDPDYESVRPLGNVGYVKSFFEDQKQQIRHLDYGGGNGKLSALLRSDGWNSRSYDPFPKNEVDLESIGKYNFITAFEVFEHVPDIGGLMRNLKRLMERECLVIFSTLLVDGNIKPNERLTWWYASPRNGHISLYSSRSLLLLAEKYGLTFGSFGPGAHCFFNTLPEWAGKILGK
jgi:Methyltransferase domain